MLAIQELYQSVKQITENYQDLKQCFARFGQLVNDQLQKEDFGIHSMEVSLNSDKKFFDIILVDSVLRFIFSGNFNNGKTLQGIVKYSIVDIINNISIPIGTFTFDNHGKTSFNHKGKALRLDELTGATRIVLYCLIESMCLTFPCLY